MIKQEKPSVKIEIQKAFMQLLLQKAYMDITVSDLVNKAQVARMSFYRNFNSLDDVVESIANDMIKNFNTDIAPVLQENSERKWRELLFEMLYRFTQFQKEFGISLKEFGKSHTNNDIIISRMREKIFQNENELSNSTSAEKYVIAGKISLIFCVVGKWALTGMQEDPEEIVNIIMSMIMKF